MKFYNVSDKYINFLRGYDSKVPLNKGRRPYVGVVLTIGDIDYLAPFSSPKESHDAFSPKNPTIHKLHEKGDPTKKLGVVHINNMIPVLLSQITLVNFSQQAQDYRDLLTKQYAFVKSTQNILAKKAFTLHDAIVNKKNPIYSRLAHVCCDFPVLEANFRNFE